jgi:hypothetical protein
MTHDRQPLGRVAAPAEHESTSGVFYFWVDRDLGVERTQIVTTKSVVSGKEVTFIGVVQEVYRRSRQKDIGEEAARFDGRGATAPMFASEGVTYAEVAILRTNPVAHTPPTEESLVYLATPQEAREGYGVDRMKHPLEIGLLKNGGTETAGSALIDLAFLLGENGGHMNVNGIAGLGTKSTLLLTINWLLLREAARQHEYAPSNPDNLKIVPVIFNVKNFDLFFIDRWNKTFRAQEQEFRSEWAAMGVQDARPFSEPKFYAPQAKGITTPVPTGGKKTGVMAYSWSLADIIEQRLFPFLFGEDDLQDANFGGLVGEMEEWLTNETSSGAKLWTDRPQTFQELLDEFRAQKDTIFMDFAKGTKGKLLRRLKFIVNEGDGVLRRNDARGTPLVIPSVGQMSPIVVDLCGIQEAPSLQRFVVAAVFHQIQQTQRAKQTRNLKYLITLDELNRFAPRDSSDPITEKLETIASEGRSQGIILLGAQQQASLVKPRVIENAAVRAIGRSGTLELGADVWKFLSSSAKSAAAQLQQDEKLIYLPSFREPMLVKIPFPPFALSENDVDHGVPAQPSGLSSKPMNWDRAEAPF